MICYELFQTANALIADAVGLYAYAMNDLGNVQPLQFEALNCKGGARWSGGEKLLEYLKGVCDYIANIKETILYFCPKI